MRSIVHNLEQGAVWALSGLVRLYRALVSPWLGGCCRFHPSCSVYCLDALHTHGLWRGLWLSVTRVARCHPFHPGGVDPVPRKPSTHAAG